MSDLAPGRRRRPDRPVRQLADRAGHPEPRLRPAPRADRERHAGALPHRRRAARDRHGAARTCSRALISRLKIMSNVDITERRVPQNGRITVQIGERKVDLRTATLPTVWGEKVVLRVLDTGGIDLDLRKLGFTDAQLRALLRRRSPSRTAWCWSPGRPARASRPRSTPRWPRSASPTVNIITVEDPVEYRLPGVNQVQVNHKAGPDLRRRAAGDPAVRPGRRADRRDPRPGHRAARRRGGAHRPPRAVHAAHQRRAQRGHPAHRDGHRAVPGRLVAGLRAGPAARPPAVRLVQGGSTRRPTTELHGRALAASEDLAGPTSLWKPVGCRTCANTGYRGRLALHEVMPVSRGDRAADGQPGVGQRDPAGRARRGHVRPARRRPAQGGRGPDLDRGSAAGRDLSIDPDPAD